MRYITIACLLFFLFCKHEAYDVVVISPSATLLDKPSPDGGKRAELALHDGLTDLGKVSSFESSFADGATETTLPWIEVQTRQGKKGWVWMGWVKPLSGDSAVWVQNKRMLCYLGPEVFLQYQNWQNSKETLTLAENYRMAQKMRDSMVYVLHHRPDAGKTTTAENWTWLTDAMPGFVFQRIDHGTKPNLFIDYRYWLDKASTTLSTSDDAFFQNMCSLYPTDSIESFFPIWTIQTDENSGCSQLGLGRHTAVLEMIDGALEKDKDFSNDLLQVKNLLLEDILGKDVCYWQNEKKTLTELNFILENNYKCLTSRDLIALKARKQMFENPQANGIRVNLRAGEQD